MPVRPPLDLTSVYAKLDRAEEHFKAAQAEISAWENSGRYEPFFERGAYGTRIGLAILRIGPPPDLTRWSVIIGDCINNLRSSLDHLIYAFAKYQAAGDPAAKIENLAFVIVDLPVTFEKDKGSRLKGFSDSFIALVASMQPYVRKHPADKNLGTKVSFINPGPIQHNDIICVVESSEPDPNLTFHSLSVAIKVCIWHKLHEGSTNPLEQRTAYDVLLAMLIGEIRYVIDTFKGAM